MVLSENEIREICETEKTVAYYSGWTGIEIKKVLNGTDDHIVYVDGAWYGKKFYGCAKVEYGKDGAPFFRVRGHRIPLDECVRC